jgi:hypothetical protein
MCRVCVLFILLLIFSIFLLLMHDQWYGLNIVEYEQVYNGNIYGGNNILNMN